MPSSTFNSDELRLPSPAKNWLAVWGITLAFAAAILGGIEGYWRSQGFRPSVVDGEELWSALRAGASNGSTKEVVLIGWSRIQLGISLDTFRSRLPQYSVTQLAIPGLAPIATFRDLANDESFRGIAICEITPYGFYQVSWEQQQEYVKHYRTVYRRYNEPEVWMSARMQQTFVMLNPELRLDKLAKLSFERKALPKAPWYAMRNDRHLFADFAFADLDQLGELADLFLHQRTGNIPKPHVWMKDVEEIEKLVKRIQDRGGKVVFTEFSSTGDYRVKEDEKWPRQDYWDKMAAATSAVTINCRDVPSLAGFKLPDDVHLDHRDAPAFTNAFIDELLRRGVVQE